MNSNSENQNGGLEATTVNEETEIDLLPTASHLESLTDEKPALRKWTREDAIQFYNIDGWSSGYFTVNEKGNLTMLPNGEGGPAIELLDILEELQQQKISLPCIVRFQDILRDRVKQLNETFLRVMAQANYKASYRGVYPIKVNQLREVIEEILDAGAPYHYGLEAGSKAELQVVLAYNTDPEALTICNGYKDSEFMRLALLGRQLGRKVIVVIEQASEIPSIIKVSQEVGIAPLLGIRAKLSSKGSGKWQESGGETAKFGLSLTEILRAVEQLREANMLESLKLLHFHIGSQITDIASLKESVVEGARLYVGLFKKGAPLEYLDLGGGLGVDYDGSRSSSNYSINYTLEEYALNAVTNVQYICDVSQVPHPHLVSESGRAITAHHSCLLMNVVEAIESMPKGDLKVPPQLENSLIVKEAFECLKSITPTKALANYHLVLLKREEALSRFKLGLVTLEERAFVEETVREIRRWIVRNRSRLKRVSDEVEEITEQTLVQYLVNFSVFQSAPDHWAFDQLFPIVPIHRMLERPKVPTTLVDISCDSDGVIDRFIARREDHSATLGLHQLNGRPYYLGMFLTGAYQDIMGDLHNLFGRVNEVHVFCDDDDPEDFYIEEVIPGDTIWNVLEENQYVPHDLCRSLKGAVDAKVREGKIKPRDGVQLVDLYERIMKGYTYLRSSGSI